MLARARANEEREALRTILGVVGNGVGAGFLTERHNCELANWGDRGLQCYRISRSTGGWGLPYRETRLQVGQPGWSEVTVTLNQSINWGDWWLQSTMNILEVNGGGVPGNSSIVRVW